jgi:hypothetical protein
LFRGINGVLRIFKDNNMERFKVPIIAGLIGFLLIVLINILKGNTIGITLLRSLIYGGLTFGVFFGIDYYFKEVLGVEISLKSLMGDVEKSKGKVDIYATDDEVNNGVNKKAVTNVEEIKEDEAEYDESKKGEEEVVFNDKEEFGTVDESLDEEVAVDYSEENGRSSEASEKEESETGEEAASEADDEEENGYGKYNGKSIKDMEELDKVDTIDYKGNGTSLENEEYTGDESNIDDSSVTEEEVDYEQYNVKSTDKGHGKPKTLKDHIGADVSFDDVVKAIRTKMKEDD